MMDQVTVEFFPNHGNFNKQRQYWNIWLAMTLNYEEIERGYKALSDFYLTLTYHTDELPVNQLLTLPAIDDIPKLPKV